MSDKISVKEFLVNQETANSVILVYVAKFFKIDIELFVNSLNGVISSRIEQLADENREVAFKALKDAYPEVNWSELEGSEVIFKGSVK